MRAGALRHRLRVQHYTGLIRNTAGEEVPDWHDFIPEPRWASVEPLSGRELIAAQQVNAEVTARVRLRYLPGLTPKMRFLHKERELLIQAIINPEERNRELEVLVTEVV
jgi:SPP1 family predicted phage head-tail adaptor